MAELSFRSWRRFAAKVGAAAFVEALMCDIADSTIITQTAHRS